MTLTGGIQVAWRDADLGGLVGALALSLLDKVIHAAWEEYTFRGVPFSICVRAVGPHPVSVVLSVVFGLLHLMNPDWSWTAIASTVLGGLLFCYTMLVTRNILIPTGLHVGWNYTQSLLTSERYWRVTSRRDAWLSGGAYGLEATLAGVVVAGLAVAGVLGLFLRNGPLAAAASDQEQRDAE